MRCKLLGIAWLLYGSTWAQVPVSGLVTDEQGTPLPFATVYEEGSTNGTVCNANGRYSLVVSTSSSQVVAQFVGYGRQAQAVPPSGELNFRLKPETLVLQEVVVSARDKDPAYSIIRSAMRKRKFYENEVRAYQCEVYIKGLQRLDKRPEKFLGITMTVDTGIVYLSESVSRLKVQLPNKVNETMISSKVSGNNNGFSWNQASDMLINMYENSFVIEGLSERPFVSPLAGNGFFYYDYKLEGRIMEDTLMINKIRLIPRRKSDPVFSGHIYIIEGSWRIHSVDVWVSKENGIEFADTVTCNQVYAPVQHGIWMPISQRFTMRFKVFGFEGSGHFTGVYRNYEIEPNYTLFRESETYTSTFGEKHEEKQLFQKGEFTRALLTVEEGANERDSIYWHEVRPVPLTPIEIKDYRIKDSIRVVKESKPYLDSMDSKRNQLKWGNLFFTPYVHSQSHRERYWEFPLGIELLQYNPVEGVVLNMEVAMRQRRERYTQYWVKTGLRYGFANQRPQAKMEAYKILDQRKSAFVEGGAGRYVFQQNENNPIPYPAITFTSFVRGLSYGKLYEKSFLYLGTQRELTNGIILNARLTYAQRNPMVNNTSFNISPKDRQFTPNAPWNEELPITTFGTHEALVARLVTRIRFGQQYLDRPDRKILLSTKYPEITVQYLKGIPLLGSDVNFDQVKAGVKDEIPLGLFGTSMLQMAAGTFLNTRSMYFLDFQHFNGNQIYMRQLEGDFLFQLLDYYQWSTRESHVQAHFEHHFNGFITRKIPLVKKLGWQAVASANYLHTNALGHYVELGGGIEHIFRFMRVDFYTSLRNGNQTHTGFRVGVGF